MMTVAQILRTVIVINTCCIQSELGKSDVSGTLILSSQNIKYYGVTGLPVRCTLVLQGNHHQGMSSGQG